MAARLQRTLLALPLIALGLALGCLPVQGQDRGNTVPRVSPNASVGQTVGVTEIQITYGRPSVRNREIFGGLVPFDEVWRTGANEATTISFSTPVRIEGKAMDAGTYGFFTIPGENEWTLIFNEKANQWGAYNYDSNKDALRITVEPEPARPQEMLTFTFQDVTDSTTTGLLHWAETRVPFDVAVDTEKILHSRAEDAVANASSWKAPLPYVGYALENNVFLDDALGWVNRSIEIEEHFANLQMKAHVMAATDQYEKAVQVGESALSKAESMDETPNGASDLRDKVSSWKEKI